MQLAGPISMMKTSLADGEAKYSLPIGGETVNMNRLVGRHIELSFQQEITCSNCGKKTNKSFSQGYCFPCARSLARCDLCIMKPETCHHHLVKGGESPLEVLRRSDVQIVVVTWE